MPFRVFLRSSGFFKRWFENSKQRKEDGKMKGKFTMVMIVGVMVSLMFLGWTDSAPAASKKYKFRFTSGYSSTAVDSMAMGKILKEITERSGGAVTFEVFWGGALGKVAEHLDLVGKRSADLGEAPLG